MRRTVLSLALIVGVVACVAILTRGQQNTKPKLKGVTIVQRVYEQNLKTQEITELGSVISHISSQGEWRKIKKDVSGKVTQDLMADATKGGVFSMVSHEGKPVAAKIAKFVPTGYGKLSTDEYRKHEQFTREEKTLGYAAFVFSVDNNGKVMAELWFVPEFDVLPIKEVSYRDGVMVVYEPTSITIGEPGVERFRVPTSRPVVDIVEPALRSKPAN